MKRNTFIERKRKIVGRRFSKQRVHVFPWRNPCQERSLSSSCWTPLCLRVWELPILVSWLYWGFCFIALYSVTADLLYSKTKLSPQNQYLLKQVSLMIITLLQSVLCQWPTLEIEFCLTNITESTKKPSFQNLKKSREEVTFFYITENSLFAYWAFKEKTNNVKV